MEERNTAPVHARFSVLMLLALVTAPSTAAEEPSGQQLYETKGCYQCHGYVGQGGAAGPRLAPQPIPLQAFRVMVRKPPNVMPAYSPRVLSEAELAAIYAYVSTLK